MNSSESFFKFIYLVLGCWVAVAVSSSPAAGRAAALLAVRAPLLSAASLAVGHRLSSTRASVVVALRLSCSVACGIFPDQRSNPCPRLWLADS